MRRFVLMATTAMSIALASPAAAVQYRFDVFDPSVMQSGQAIDNNSYHFFADSSPTPASSNGFSFDLSTTIFYRVTFSGGAFSDYVVPTTLTFYNDQAGGGFDDGASFSAFSGPALYTGAAATPTFKLGGPYSYADRATVTISNPAATGGVPEPATWALMLAGFGMVGVALRARRPARVRFG